MDTQKDTVAGFSYTPGKETAQPMMAMYGLSMSENGYDNTITTEHSTNKRNCGALVVIRMPDNSLFIHDGGDLEQWSDEACHRFMEFCRELTGKSVGEKVTINTWFLSHAHTDHYLGLPRFFSRCHEQLDLKYIMYNIDIERTYTTRDIAGIKFDVIYSHEDRYVPNESGELITDYPKIENGTPVSAYDIGGTYRDFCYETDGKSDFNDTSTVLRVHMDENTDALLYADMNLAEQILFDIYPDSALETDIMMIPHHGFDSHPELCDLSNAKIFLFIQHRGTIYGADGDLSTKDPAGEYRPALYNNYMEMQQYIETPGSKTYWAGNKTVCLTVGDSASVVPDGMTQATAPTGFTAYTAEAYSFEYEGWTVDANDGTAADGEWVDTFRDVTTNSFTMRFNPVTNQTLETNKQYVIVHDKTDYVGSAVVHVVEQIAVSGTRLDIAGTVSRNAGVGAVPQVINSKTGETSDCQISVTYNTANGHVTRQIPLSVGMLTDSKGNPIDTSIEGIYKDLTVTYQGVRLTGTFTLTVTGSNDVLNYPVYPEEGSVRVDKEGVTTLGEFDKTGVAQIELSATGIPTSNGVDLIVVMDLSGSMRYGLDNTSRVDQENDAATRLYAMEQSLKQMVTMLRESGADVRIAMSDFGDLDSHEFEGAIIDYSIREQPFFDVDFSNAYRRNNDHTAKFYEFSNYLNFP